jgi:hypothetical protein
VIDFTCDEVNVNVVLVPLVVHDVGVVVVGQVHEIVVHVAHVPGRGGHHGRGHLGKRRPRGLGAIHNFLIRKLDISNQPHGNTENAVDDCVSKLGKTLERNHDVILRAHSRESLSHPPLLLTGHLIIILNEDELGVGGGRNKSGNKTISLSLSPSPSVSGALARLTESPAAVGCISAV